MAKLLGCVEAVAETVAAERRSWLGGAPAWLSEAAPSVPACGVCGGELRFVSQIYAPLSNCDRALHLFVCEEHIQDSRGWHVARTQRSSNPQQEENSASEKTLWTAAADWSLDDEDDDIGLDNLDALLTTKKERTKKTKTEVNKEQFTSYRRSEIAWYENKEKDFSSDEEEDGDELDLVSEEGDMKRARAYLENDTELSTFTKASLQAALEGKVIESSPIKNQGDNEEVYETLSKTATANLRLTGQLRRMPSLVVRYEYSGKPIFMHETKVPKCLCGASRSFECEFLPTLVYFLGTSEMNDIASVAVWSCDTSCPASQVEYISVLPPSGTAVLAIKDESFQSDDEPVEAAPVQEIEPIDPWQKRWAVGRTAFHLSDVHYILRKRESLLELTPDSRLLLPLCGKTVDLAYLAEKCQVVGVDAIDIALQQFIAEHKGKITNTTDSNCHTIQLSQDVQLHYVVGDFFKFDFGVFDAVFDRGAMVAIDPRHRPAYVQVLLRCIRPGAKILLVATEHPPFGDGRLGPPYNLTQDQVHSLYDQYCTIEHIEREDRFQIEDVWKERGCSSFYESTYILTRR